MLTSQRETDIYLCLAIIDIDSFKNYNDHYGHLQGDECLREVGGALNRLRNNANMYAARIGGEEFAVLWFENSRNGVKNDVLQIHKVINKLNIPHVKSTTAKHLSVSIGVYVTHCGVSDNIQEMYNFADNMLYEAKTSGKNCAVIWGDDMKKTVIRP
jgi:diguanylate cyclase (GGDEF)-like protein